MHSLLSVIIALVFAAALYDIYSYQGYVPTTEEYIKNSGYPCETHKIQTEDGYSLTAFRIPHGKEKSEGKRPVIWLQHCLMGSSDFYVQIGPGSALGYLLADKGYDVWLGNARGNRYSSENITDDSLFSKYWDFSWDEMGYFDLAAEISYVLNTTKQDKIYYVGHSMGMALPLVLLSTRPEFQKKIEVTFGMASAVFMNNCYSPFFKFVCQVYAPFFNKIIGPSHFIAGFSRHILNWLSCKCSPDNVLSPICKFFYNSSFGSTTLISPENIYTFTRSSPSQTSLKTLAQYGQIIESGKFHAFDYGKVVNQEKYGSLEAKPYHIGNINTSIALLFSDSDSVSALYDQYLLCKSLPHVVEYYRIPVSTFNHMDFLYSSSAEELVYRKIFEILDKGPRIHKKKADCYDPTILNKSEQNV